MKYDMEHKEDYRKNYEDTFEMKDRKYRSSTLTNGLGRSGQRALLYAADTDKEDMKKPFVAVIGPFSEMVPRHVHLRELTEYAKQGIIEAESVPRQSEATAICDGLYRGRKGICYPLASRDLVADSVEMMAGAHHFNAMVLLPGCDKIIPGMLMAVVGLDIPAVIVPGGPTLPGNVGGNPLFCSSEFRGYPGRVEMGTVTVEETKEAEKAALLTVGSRARLGAASSMYTLTEVLGMALPGVGTAPTVSNKRERIAKASGRYVLEFLRKGITLRKVFTREFTLNGITGTMVTSSSASLAPHLMAAAHEAEVKLGLEDFDRISRQIPFVCNLQPPGKYPIVLLSVSDGISVMLKTVESRIHGGVPTAAGSILRKLLRQVRAAPDDILKSMESSQKPEGGTTMLRGNLAPRDAVVKQSGVRSSMYHFKGRARVFSFMEEADEAISNNTIERGTATVIRYEGPKRGPGVREILSITILIVGRGMDENCALATDSHFSGATHDPYAGHASPETASEGLIGLVEDGGVIEVDIAGRGLHLEVSQEEPERRKMVFVPMGKPKKFASAKHTALASSTDTGAAINMTGP